MTIYTEMQKAPDLKPNAFFEKPNNLHSKLSDISLSVALGIETINHILHKSFSGQS